MPKRARDAAAPVILVDMDDTVADFTGRALALMRTRHPHVRLPRAEATTFPLANSLAESERPLLSALYSVPG